MSSILVVDDEDVLQDVLGSLLRKEGHTPIAARTGEDALTILDREEIDLVLLDLMLPGKDGLAVCRDLRASSDVPIVMITARVDEVDRLLGLELGADDYICKPFSPREVVARVRAILRRAQRPQDAVIAGLAIDAKAHRASLDGVPLDLTPVEFRLLRALAEAPGRVLGRQRLLEGLYDDHRVVTDRTVDSHVKNLRRKLAEAAPARDLVRSVYGVGYTLEL